jgi:hypothetical protein
MAIAGQANARFLMSDGATNKILWGYTQGNTSTFNETFGISFDFVVFLSSGEKLIGDATNGGFIRGSYRQLADVNGNAVNPSGFTPQ